MIAGNHRNRPALGLSESSDSFGKARVRAQRLGRRVVRFRPQLDVAPANTTTPGPSQRSSRRASSVVRAFRRRVSQRAKMQIAGDEHPSTGRNEERQSFSCFEQLNRRCVADHTRVVKGRRYRAGAHLVYVQ